MQPERDSPYEDASSIGYLGADGDISDEVAMLRLRKVAASGSEKLARPTRPNFARFRKVVARTTTQHSSMSTLSRSNDERTVRNEVECEK